jgi:hypothetical protein
MAQSRRVHKPESRIWNHETHKMTRKQTGLIIGWRKKWFSRQRLLFSSFRAVRVFRGLSIQLFR